METWLVLRSFYLQTLPCVPINILYGLVWNNVFTPGLVLPIGSWLCPINCRNRHIGRLIQRLLFFLDSWLIVGTQSAQVFFYRYYFGRCILKLSELVPLSYLCGRCSSYSNRLHPFSDTISRFYIDDYVSSFFPCLARLRNSLYAKWILLMYDLNGFKSRMNKYLLFYPLSNQHWYVLFIFAFFFFF